MGTLLHFQSASGISTIMKNLLIILSLMLISSSALAQSTAEQTQPGFLTTTGCLSGQTVCFKPYTSTNPLAVGVYDASNTPGDCLISNGSSSAATFQACGGGGSGSPGGATNSVQYNAGGGNFGGVLPIDAQLLLGQTGSHVAAVTMSGDATIIDTGVITVAKVNGVSYGTSPSTNTVPVVTGTNTVTYEAVPNAALANSAIIFGATSQALGSTVTNLNAVNVGPTTPGTGAFTTVSASSTVSGTGFSTYLASPPAIGGSAAAAGNFTTLGASGNITSNITGSTQCVHANSSGVLSGTGSDCGSGGGGTITLGTSAAATNPQRTSEAGTGLYSATDLTVSVAANGVPVQQWNTLTSGVDYLLTTPGKSGTAIDTAVAGSTASQGITYDPKLNGVITFNNNTNTSAFSSIYDEVVINGVSAYPNGQAGIDFDIRGALVGRVFAGDVSGYMNFFGGSGWNFFTEFSGDTIQFGQGFSSLTNIDFQVLVGNGSDYIQAGGGTGAATLSVVGSSTNDSLNLTAKGNGTVSLNGHVGSTVGSTSAPTCGTGCASITSGSTDVRGSFVTSTSITAATLNFGTTWTSTPFCVISDNSTAALADISTISTTILTVTFASSLSSATVYYSCVQ